MKQKSFYRYIELIFVLVVIALFFKYSSNEISYGLPSFWNRDETPFQGSVLSSFSILTGYFEKNYNSKNVKVKTKVKTEDMDIQ